MSCPGKVLLVGGYLVLQEGTPGLVVSTSARFFSTLEWVPAAAQPAAASHVAVDVCSPQFGAEWRYALPAAPPYVPVPQDAARRNPYVEYALAVALAAAAAGPADTVGRDPVAAALAAPAAAGRVLRLTLRADNDFYSQRAHLLARGLAVTRAHLAALPRFLPCPRDGVSGAAAVSKTGLGSSAALVTSVVGATLALLGGVALPDGSAGVGAAAAAARLLVHDAAQLAHGLAQGKIGSGFDVCAAALGSLRFTRVPPAVLGAAMEAADAALRAAAAAAAATAGADGDAVVRARRRYARLGALLRCGMSAQPPPHLPPAVSAAAPAAHGEGDGSDDGPSALPGWRFTAAPFGLPRGLSLALADVAGGSETPSMVRRVLEWRDRCGGDGDDEASPLAVCADAEQRAAAEAAGGAATGPPAWRRLAAANARVDVVVSQLRRLYEGAADANAAAAPRVSVVEYDAALAVCAREPRGAWRGLSLAAAAAAATSTASQATPATSTVSTATPHASPHASGLGLVAGALADLADAFDDARSLLRGIGLLAGVPIEPPAQTALADATLAVPGEASGQAGQRRGVSGGWPRFTSGPRSVPGGQRRGGSSSYNHRP